MSGAENGGSICIPALMGACSLADRVAVRHRLSCIWSWAYKYQSSSPSALFKASCWGSAQEHGLAVLDLGRHGNPALWTEWWRRLLLWNIVQNKGRLPKKKGLFGAAPSDHVLRLPP